MSANETANSAQTTPVHPPGFRARRGMNWFMLGLSYASFYMCRYNLSVAAPRIIDYFGFTNADYGKINSARHWCYSAGQLINGSRVVLTGMGVLRWKPE